MKRFFSFNKQEETIFINDLFSDLEQNSVGLDYANSILNGAAKSEPLIEESFNTPQDPRYHSEGPFLKSHLVLMFQIFYSLLHDGFSFKKIEEFKSLKGFENELDEIEHTIKENSAFFEVFMLCHDVAKWNTVSFQAKSQSFGFDLGFTQTISCEPGKAFADISKLRKTYLELFHEFEEIHPDESPRSIQKQFYSTYEIDVHYPRHDVLIHTPVYESLLDRFGVAFRLSSIDRAMMEDVIAIHMRFGEDFTKINSKRISRYVRLAQVRGYDTDHFLRILQGCLFLDRVCGSLHTKGDLLVHDVQSFINCLKSEHDYKPERLIQRQKDREEQKRRDRNNAFRLAKLDGLALMDLLKMEPGPNFGRVLKTIQVAIIGETEMPMFGRGIDREIEKRAEEFYQFLFKHEA